MLLGDTRTKALIVFLFTLFMFTSSAGRASAQRWHQVGDTRPRADTAWLSVNNRTIEIKVEHKGGIGKIEFIRDEGRWPPLLRLVFHNFKALEKFRIWTAEKNFETSISDSNKRTGTNLGQGFTATRQGNSIIVDGPRRFIKKKEPFIRVEWIDFYRH